AAIITPQPITSPIKRLFNGAQFALCGYTSGVVFHALGGDLFHPEQAGWVEHVIGPFLAALATFVAIILTLMAAVLVLSRVSTVAEQVRDAGAVALGCLGYGMVGLLLGGVWPP